MSDKKCVAENWSHALQKTRSSSTPFRPSPLKSTDRYRPARGLRLCGNPFIHTRRREAAIGHAINEAATAYRPLLHFRIKRSIRPGSGLGTAGHVIVNSLASRRRLASRRPPGRTFDKLKKTLPVASTWPRTGIFPSSLPSQRVHAFSRQKISVAFTFSSENGRLCSAGKQKRERERGGQNYWPTKFFNSRVSGSREIPLGDLSSRCLWSCMIFRSFQFPASLILVSRVNAWRIRILESRSRRVLRDAKVRIRR